MTQPISGHGGRSCWSCSFRWDVNRDNLKRAEQYEAAVMLVESKRDSDFTIRGLLDEMCPPFDYSRTGYARHAMSTVIANAVHDMAMHGLVRCVKRVGRVCYLWRCV